MKNIMLLSAGIMLFCIVPISNTQAMPCRAPGEISFAFNTPHPGLSVFNQKKLRDMDAELSNPAFTNNVLSYGMKVLHEKTPVNESILMAGRAHVHTDQRDHLKKPEPAPHIVDDENEDEDVDLDEGEKPEGFLGL